MKCKLFVISAILAVMLSAIAVHGFEDDALAFERDSFQSKSESIESTASDGGLLSKMFARGKLLLKSIPGTIKVTADRVFNLVPTPETIFRVSKQALIGLPQEVIAYTVNSMCKCKGAPV